MKSGHKVKSLTKTVEGFLKKKDFERIQKHLGFEFQGNALDENGNVSTEFMIQVMMAMDQKLFKLKDIKIEEISRDKFEEEIAKYPVDGIFVVLYIYQKLKV